MIIISIMAIILIGVALYSVSRQRNLMEGYTQELKDSLSQAKEVKKDLEAIMADTVTIGQGLVDEIDKRLEAIAVARNPISPVLVEDKSILETELYEESEPELFGPLLPGGEEVLEHEHMLCEQIRVYELAMELGLSSKQVLEAAKSLGYNVKHHMNLLNQEQIKGLKDFYNVEMSGLLPEEDFPLLVLAKSISPDTGEISAVDLQETMVNDWEETSPAPGLAFPLSASLEDLKVAHPYIAVRTLTEQGYTVKEIAQMLDRGEGEIILIQNLSRKKQA